MGLRLLIAEPRSVYRKGLYTLFSHDSSVQSIYEAATVAELQIQLRTSFIDFVIVNQTFITDISLLVNEHFVIITDKPDRAILDAAINYGLCGYLLDTSLEALICLTLHLPPEQCLIDPALTRWAVKLTHGDTLAETADQALTVRVEDVFALRKKGRSYKQISEHLCISKETVKKHIQHIARKLNIKPGQIRNFERGT